MDWGAFTLSLQIAALTVALLLPVALFASRWLALRQPRGIAFIEAALTLPLVLPPTVIGYYLLIALGCRSPIGAAFEDLFGHPPVFHFSGLVVASLVVNIPFAVQPMQRAFEAIPRDVLDAADCCGLGFWRRLLRVEIPLAWPGVLTAFSLTFAHTLGEFGVVLMVGGNIEGETRTAAIAVYDQVQAFEFDAAGRMALLLLFIAVAILTTTLALSRRPAHSRVQSEH